MSESASPPRRFRVSIREVMGLVALAALACVWPGLIATQVVAVLTWVRARRGSEPARGRLVSLGVVLAAVYFLPLANFFLVPAEYRSGYWYHHGANWPNKWSMAFPFVPGILPAFLLSCFLPACLRSILLSPSMRPHADVVGAVAGSLATAAVVYALTLLAGRSESRRAYVGTLSFGWSGFSTWLTTAVLSNS